MKTQWRKAKKVNCISIYGVNYEMKFSVSDFDGFYLYKLIPMELGYDPTIIYIAPNCEDHWLYDKPMKGMQIKLSEILYFHTYK